MRSIDLGIERSFELGELEYGDELDLVKAVINEFDIKKGFELVTNADMPPGSGMGTSSSMAVALIGCLTEFTAKPMDRDSIAMLAYHVERDELGQKGGYQDQYAAAFGGLNYIEFFKGRVVVNPLHLKPEVLKELQDRLLLLFTGETRLSSEIHEEMAERYVKEKKDQLESLHSLKRIADEMKKCLLGGDLEGFGELLHEGWVEKRRLSEKITNPEIEQLYEIARQKGAIGGKILGAGGGGHLLVFCEPRQKLKVANELVKYGARRVPFKFEPRGLQTWRVK